MAIKTVRELAEAHPEIRDYYYKWRDTMESHLEKSIDEVLASYGYKFFDEDIESGDVIIGEYNDLQGYLNCGIVPIVTITTKVMSDRFFLEEIVFRTKVADECGGSLLEYVMQLQKDWMHEFIEELPLTEEERIAYIEEHYSIDDLEERYFGSEAELIAFLKI